VINRCEDAGWVFVGKVQEEPFIILLICHIRSSRHSV
jgi:hypothetical protein